MKDDIKAIKEDEKLDDAIDSNLLLSSGGNFKNYNKGEYIFKEGQQPQFYHQIFKGKVRLVNELDDGREFIQGFFLSGQSFGEPPIFTENNYPASAIAVEPSSIIRLSNVSFNQLLKENFDVHWTMTKLLSQRLQKKSLALKEFISHKPEQRILSLLDILKEEEIKKSAAEISKIKIDYSRKQIADMTGLRVETVIRVMRNLHEKNVLIIEKGKVFY